MNEIMKIDSLSVVKPKMLEMGLSPEKFTKEAGFACQIYNNQKNSYLRRCTNKSFLDAVMSIAQTGLTLNPVSKEAYLIPRKVGRGNDAVIEVNLEPSYIGLMKLLTDAGQVKNIQVNLVYDGCEFDINLGLETEIKHKPYYINGNMRGNIQGVYAVATLEEGGKQFEYMTCDEVFKIREGSESYKSYLKQKKEGKSYATCIWVTDESEMFRKTVVRRISKYLPRSEKYDNAVELLNKDFQASESIVIYVDELLRTSILGEMEAEQITRELPTMSASRANDLITYLKDNQKDASHQYISTQKQVNELMDQKLDNPES